MRPLYLKYLGKKIQEEFEKKTPTQLVSTMQLNNIENSNEKTLTHAFM